MLLHAARENRHAHHRSCYGKHSQLSVQSLGWFATAGRRHPVCLKAPAPSCKTQCVRQSRQAAHSVVPEGCETEDSTRCRHLPEAPGSFYEGLPVLLKT